MEAAGLATAEGVFEDAIYVLTGAVAAGGAAAAVCVGTIYVLAMLVGAGIVAAVLIAMVGGEYVGREEGEYGAGKGACCAARLLAW